MRSRSNSGVRLDKLMYLTHSTILNRMDPVTSLFRSNVPGFEGHAWIRDNVYAVHSVWGMALAYRKNADFDEDIAKVHELEQICVKVMRSLLTCMMRQVEKVERFKRTQLPPDSLHAKFSARTMSTVVGDRDWGHLQIDAISLFLLTLAQLTASGMQIVYNLDEVAFVQNLVFYIENAYRIPDFGVWERGDKTNQGLPELNASSIGMAKAALEALNDLDLFGAHGSKASVIHVLADEIEQCNAILESLLPRESYSKETDGALLSIISYPAFAVGDSGVIARTRTEILQKLVGKYGCKRFLRDGYCTPIEDPNRLYYEPVELQKFEKIECEWPLFYCFLVLDGIFTGNHHQEIEFRDKLEEVLVKGDNGLRLVPELYTLPSHAVEVEYLCPGSQERKVGGSVPYLWAQSLFILVELIGQGFIKPSELDPLNRRFSTEKRPDTVVQVVCLAENEEVQKCLKEQHLNVQTVEEVQPFTVLPASTLGKIYSHLGRSNKMKLTGRPSSEVGLLSTSKLYSIDDRFFVFTPQFLDTEKFYLNNDTKIMVDLAKLELGYVKNSWSLLGRPLVIIKINEAMMERTHQKGNIGIPMGLVGTLKKIKSGYLSGTRVIMGHLEEFLTTSCITSLDFLRNLDHESVDEDTEKMLDILLTDKCGRSGGVLLGSVDRPALKRLESSSIPKKKISVIKSMNMTARHRSIMLDPNDADMIKLKLRYSQSQSPGSTARESESSTLTTPEIKSGEITPTSPEVFSRGPQSREDTPQGDVLKTLNENFELTKVSSRLQIESLEDLDCDDLVEMLNETESIEEQGDLVYCLWLKKGPDWETGIPFGKGVTVANLTEELYIKACHSHTWWLVRLCAGLLEKRVDDLAKAVTDLLVRQKQITVGMPAIKEENISRPLPPQQLQQIIKNTFGADINSVVLTQEILIYLGMFARTEPMLFSEMFRLRVGLIIQVMASELARALKKSVEEASQHLLNISPFELKTLLYHILSGKEVEDAKDVEEFDRHLCETECLAKEEKTGLSQLRKKILTRSAYRRRKQTTKKSMPAKDKKIQFSESEDELESSGGEEEMGSGGGQWVRRRRIDGALNRVPSDFYAKVWNVLRVCEAGISVGGRTLDHNLTKEMTTEEIKFAVKVESVLNQIPEPEYRQLLVETLMVLTLMGDNAGTRVLLTQMGTLKVEDFTHKANSIFIQDQKDIKGEAIHCCAGEPPINCGGVNGICKFFYDMPPSGRFGTITYMCRAAATVLPHQGSDLECPVQ